ncbi:MAG: hypothetical protein RIQ46_1716, partial [Pseudomonadota bacterium]
MSGKKARTAPAWLAGAAAMLPLAALNAMPAAEAAEAQASFTPPDAPLLLTRTLRSPLADGREIVSRRSYEVTIKAEDGGWRVDGRLLDSEVSAPPQLAFLAEMERKRPDEGLFPLFLDAQGRIVIGGQSASGDSRQKAAEASLAAVDSRATDAETRQTADGLLGMLKRQPVLTAWPEDLFHPMPGHRATSRAITLPDGTRGEIAMEVDSRPARQDRSRVSASSIHRVITTRMGANARALREEWTLAPAPE